MENQVTHQLEQPDPAMVVQRLTHLLRSRLGSVKDRDDVASMVWAISDPASPVWILARVAALLSPYYEKDTPQAVREMEAEDWLDALKQYPEWAIIAAVRWWKGLDNPDRRKRPMEGDIAARAWIETDVIRAGKIQVQMFDTRPEPLPYIPEAPREILPAEARAKLAEELGLPNVEAYTKKFGTTQ